ncbi:MAG: helix-turn-helix transcriptional regulator, partial [bacterium]|nr:helix-turn-helix transcriptional regulator [bacterium]
LGALGWFKVRKFFHVRRMKRKYKNSTLEADKADITLKKLKFLLEVKKVYKNEDISLNSLAEKLKIAPRYLSQIMNEQMDKSFWDLINNYRIREAKRMLKTGEMDSILDIAYTVGFNSKVAFNRAFKKFTNMTPTQYRKSVKE